MHALARAAGRGTGRPALLPIAEALDYVAYTGMVHYEARVHRLESDRSRGRGEERREACSRRAIAIARALQEKSFELRAATSLARGARAAGTGVRLVHRGFDTADLKDAKALL